MTTEPVTDHETHSPLDTLLGAAPRRVMRHWLSLLLLALAGLGAMAFFVRFVNGEDTPYYSAPVERGDLIPLVSEQGQIHGSGEVDVFAPLDGRVVWVSTKKDGDVEEGELLARIDAGAVQSAVAVNRARVRAAQAELDAARVSAQDAGTRLSRFESVWKRSGGRAPSLNELERARADARRADLAIASAQADVDAARLQLKGEQTRAAGTEVHAPMAGILTMRRVQPGQTVRAHDALFTIAAGTAPMTVEVPLGVQPSGPFKAGTKAQVRLDTLPDVPQSATMTLLRVSPPPQTAPPRAVFTIERPDPRVRPGSTATVEIELPRRRNVLLVPDAALSFEPGSRPGARRERIYILEDGEPRRVYVSVGGSDGKRTEVFANSLQPGVQVITGWRDATSGPEPSGP